MKGDLGMTNGPESAYVGVDLQSGDVLLDDDVNEERSCIWLLLVVLLGLVILVLLRWHGYMPCCRSRACWDRRRPGPAMEPDLWSGDS